VRGLTEDVAAELIREVKRSNAEQLAPLLQRVNEVVAAKALEAGEPRQGDVHHHNVTVNTPPINVQIPDIHVPQPHITVPPPQINIAAPQPPVRELIDRHVERDEHGRITKVREETVTQVKSEPSEE